MDVSTYDDQELQQLQANTSQPGWDPVTVPSLWQDDGPI